MKPFERENSFIFTLHLNYVDSGRPQVLVYFSNNCLRKGKLYKMSAHE